MSSNRVAFYITGATYKKEKKLLGCPETEDGTGAAEAKVVTDLLTEWELKPEICGMVFDTTSSNTGAEIGACKLVEDWLERPILWCGCRHHVYELHLKRLVQQVTGTTTDPGVPLFRRLKSQWYTIDIDYTNLSLLDTSSLPDWMQQEASSVLTWADREMMKNTWPRADYKELLTLTIVCLGGSVPGFSSKYQAQITMLGGCPSRYIF